MAARSRGQGAVTAKGIVENDDDLELIFDGAGTKRIPVPKDHDSDYHDLHTAVSGSAAV